MPIDLHHEDTKATKITEEHEHQKRLRELRVLRDSVMKDCRVYFFSIASRFALNSLPGFHSGILSASATR
jgi:hypothetical protein